MITLTSISKNFTPLVLAAMSLMPLNLVEANPFSDVPKDHWARDAADRLAADGVIEGYGDGTFLGDRNITRYEMAQMVSRAMSKALSSEDKALVDHLAAEFDDELSNLGVRVDNVENFAEKLYLDGELCFTYTTETHKMRPFRFSSHKTHGQINDMLYRVNGIFGINDHWSLKARWEANIDTSKDAPSLDLRLERAWAEGKYDDLTLKVGRIFYLSDFDGGFMLDTEFSGGQIEYGKKWKGVLSSGRINNYRSTYYPYVIYDDDHDGIYETGIINESASDFNGAEFKYQDGRWNGGLAYYVLQNSGYKVAMKDDQIRLAEAAIGYRFDKNIALDASYIKNTQLRSDRNVNNSDRSYNIRATYKGFKFEEPGTFTIWLAYRDFGYVTNIETLYKDVMHPGQQGWEVGTYYTFFPNIVSTFEFFYGHDTEFKRSESRTSKFLFCTEFFFK